MKNKRIYKNVITFDGDLIEEGSWGERDIGTFKNRMEFEPESGIIIWNYGKAAPDEDEEVIGLWFDEDKYLYDYDGVFSLPKPAIELLESLGYNCDYAKD